MICKRGSVVPYLLDELKLWWIFPQEKTNLMGLYCSFLREIFARCTKNETKSTVSSKLEIPSGSREELRVKIESSETSINKSPFLIVNWSKEDDV